MPLPPISIVHLPIRVYQAFHSAVKKFEENETAGVKGAAKVRKGPLAGSRDSVPVGVRGRSPLRKIGVSGHFEAKYGLF